MNDSGAREEFSTGAVRDTAAGKPRPDLISPVAELRLAEWLATGAAKYAPRNWESGIPLTRHVASLKRHLLAYQLGDESEDHLAGVLCNAMFLLHTDEMVRRGELPEEINDLPDYGEPVR